MAKANNDIKEFHLFAGIGGGIYGGELLGHKYYQQSNRLIGIGAFPLRPDQELHANDGSIIIDANSSEQALRNQIRHWLEDDNGREQLLEDSIPQKGLEYSDEPVNKGTFYVASVDSHVNSAKELILNGQGKMFFSGYKSILSGVDFQKIKYFAPVDYRLCRLPGHPQQD